jgi:hypothetical protein
MVTAAGYRSGPQVVIFPGLLLLAVAHDHVITTPGGWRPGRQAAEFGWR